MKKISLIIISSLFILTCCTNAENTEAISGKDPFPEITLDVHPDGYDVKYFLNKGTKEAFYRVDTKFPAKDIISFYEERFKEKNLTPYFDGVSGNARWEVIDPKSGERMPVDSVPAHYVAVWVDKEKTRRYGLFLRYWYKAGGEIWKETLLVNLTVYKFFNLKTDFKELDNFEERLMEKGKMWDFYEMLDKYKDKKGQYDLNKALKENPKNKELKEYIKIYRIIEERLESR